MRDANVEMVARVLACINLAECLDMVASTANFATKAASPESSITNGELSELIDGAVDGLAWLIVNFSWLEDHIGDHGAMFAPWGHDSTARILANTDRQPALHHRPKTAQAWVHEIAFELWVRIYEFSRPVDPKSAADYLSEGSGDRLVICNLPSPNPRIAIRDAAWIARHAEQLPDNRNGHFQGLEWSDDLARAIAPVAESFALAELSDDIRHELREWMTRYIPTTEHQSTIDAAEALAKLEVVQHDMRFAPRLRRATPAPSGQSRRGPTVNQSMAAMFQADPSLSSWPARKWAEKLGVSEAAVKQTHTWRVVIRTARAHLQSEQATRRQ